MRSGPEERRLLALMSINSKENRRGTLGREVYGRLPLFGRLCGSGERRVQSGREHDVINAMVSTRRSATNGRWSEAMSAALLL